MQPPLQRTEHGGHEFQHVRHVLIHLGHDAVVHLPLDLQIQLAHLTLQGHELKYGRARRRA